MSGLGFDSGVGTSTGAVLAQLIAKGSCDVNLTGSPTTTFWRCKVERNSNFAMEDICSHFNQQAAFGTTCSITVPKCGDLLYHTYIVASLPGLEVVAKDGASATYPVVDTPGVTAPSAWWVNRVGYALIREVGYSIGGQKIDGCTSHFLDIWEELTSGAKRLKSMIGSYDSQSELIAASASTRRLYVPLPFIRHSGLAISLVSLQFHSLQIHVSFADAKDLIQTNAASGYEVVTSTDKTPVSKQHLTAMLECTYVYLDLAERTKFSQASFSQLITQTQMWTNTFQANTSDITARLSFNHPVLELMWTVSLSSTADANEHFDYSNMGEDIIDHCSLYINNLCRFSREASYFSTKMPYVYHSRVPVDDNATKKVYVYSFALQPESDMMPSGSINFSRLDNAEMKFTLKPEIINSGATVTVRVYAKNFNLLRYKQGLCGLAYSN